MIFSKEEREAKLRIAKLLYNKANNPGVTEEEKRTFSEKILWLCNAYDIHPSELDDIPRRNRIFYHTKGKDRAMVAHQVAHATVHGIPIFILSHRNSHDRFWMKVSEDEYRRVVDALWHYMPLYEESLKAQRSIFSEAFVNANDLYDPTVKASDEMSEEDWDRLQAIWAMSKTITPIPNVKKLNEG